MAKEVRTERAWRCDACRSPIQDHCGHIEIRDNRIGDWRHYDPDALDNGPDVFGEVQTQVNDALLSLTDPGVSFVVCCSSCGKAQESLGYIVPLNSVRDFESWCVWADHVGNKNWMRKRDVIRMIRFWWLGHGEEVPPLL